MEISFKIPGVGVQTKGAPHVILKYIRSTPIPYTIFFSIGVDLIYFGSAYGPDPLSPSTPPPLLPAGPAISFIKLQVELRRKLIL